MSRPEFRESVARVIEELREMSEGADAGTFPILDDAAWYLEFYLGLQNPAAAPAIEALLAENERLHKVLSNGNPHCGGFISRPRREMSENSTEQRFFCVHVQVDDVGIYEDSADIAGEIADALREANFEPVTISTLSFLDVAAASSVAGSSDQGEK